MYNISDVKKIILNLGFHHSWGYWILNKIYKIKICKTKNNIVLYVSKNNIYYNSDIITINKNNINIDNLKNKISTYFNI